ncbi:MAG: hypothetical protein NTW87_25740 [Planctomycetota bacterium]|nr:hypothetical protein [Planctomycetota bacterium]
MAEQKKGPDPEDLARMRRQARDAVESRRRRGRILRMFAGAAVFGLLVGLGVVYKDQLLALLERKPERVVVAPPPKPPAVIPPREKEVTPSPPPVAVPLPPTDARKRAVEPPPQAVSTVDDAQAKGLIAQGKALIENLEFAKAAALFKDAATKKIGPAVKAEATEWAQKAEAFDAATRHVTVSKFALADVSYIIETTDGREIQCLKKREDDNVIELINIPRQNPATTGESSWPLPKSDIQKITEVPKKQRQEEFLQLLGQLESNAVIQQSTDYYDLVYISKRLGLGRECLAYLNRAYNGGPGHEPDHYLGDSFRKERIRRTIDQCSLMLASGRPKHLVVAELTKLTKMFSDYPAAQEEVEAFKIHVLRKVPDDFKSTLREVRKTEVAAAKVDKKAETKAEVKAQRTAKEVAEADQQIEFVVENEGVRGRGAAAPLVEQANAKYDEGMKMYRGFRLGTNGNNNQILKSAMVSLEAAVNLYDEALRKDPGNKSVLDRQTEANMIVYACKKYRTLER